MFESLTNSFTSAMKRLRFTDDSKSLAKALVELKKSLLKADVHHLVVKQLISKIEIETKSEGIGKDQFTNAIERNLYKLLQIKGNQGFVYNSKPPTVILMMGLQGSGKTTTTGKLANYLKLRNKKVLVAAADLQRLAAVEQLKQVANSIEVDIFFNEKEKDPIKIAKSAVAKAKADLYDVLIIDTAGRLAIDDLLMNELEKIKKAVNPFETFYVADSLTGQAAVQTALTFEKRVGINGVILSKYDGDSKGGIAIGIASQVGVPLRFIGLGEKMADFELFLPDRIVNRLMGAGDIEGLKEKTSAVIDEKSAKKLTKKIKKGQFNFNDFLQQMEAMKKMGSMKSIMGMIPGMSNMASSLKNVDLENSLEFKNIRSMIGSMTKKERQNPDLLNASRKERLAKGSGVSLIEINQAIKKFKNSAKMMKKFSSKGGMKNFENMMQGNNMSAISRKFGR